MTRLFDDTSITETEPIGLEPEPDVSFILAGLKVAQNTPESIREQVVSDVSLALNCNPKDLDFMFTSGNDNDPTIYDFPDSERRRAVLEANKITAE